MVTFGVSSPPRNSQRFLVPLASSLYFPVSIPLILVAPPLLKSAPLTELTLKTYVFTTNTRIYKQR